MPHDINNTFIREVAKYVLPNYIVNYISNNSKEAENNAKH